MIALFLGVAAIGTSMVCSSTASTLIAARITGEAWSGMPMAAGVLGTALGAFGGGMLVQRRGIRYALLLMYALAVGGAGLAFLGAVTSSLLALMLGMALIGLGAGAAQLSRYAAAELYPDSRKGFGLSVIVWAGTIGALAGPALLAPTAAAAERLELTRLSGPIMAAGLMVAVAAVASVFLPRMKAATESPPSGRRFAALRTRVVATPLVAMVAAHVAMVAVMTMTPLQLEHGGHGLTELGWVLGAHMVGMFALAPLSGRIADRWGAPTAIYLGIALLAMSVGTVIAAPMSHDVGLPVGLFLLGYGWNLVFVGGSNLLSRALPAGDRAHVQGAVDACIWSASALASISAGPLFGLGGLVLVAIIAGVIALAPLLIITRPATPVD